jgi:hypothetical protein
MSQPGNERKTGKGKIVMHRYGMRKRQKEQKQQDACDKRFFVMSLWRLEAGA